MIDLPFLAGEGLGLYHLSAVIHIDDVDLANAAVGVVGDTGVFVCDGHIAVTQLARAVFGQVAEHQRIVLDLGQVGRAVFLTGTVADAVGVRQLRAVDVVHESDGHIRGLAGIGCDVDVDITRLFFISAGFFALDGLDVVVVALGELVHVKDAAQRIGDDLRTQQLLGLIVVDVHNDCALVVGNAGALVALLIHHDRGGMRLDIDAAGAGAEVIQTGDILVSDADPLAFDGDIFVLVGAVKDGADLAPLALFGVGDIEACHALGQILHGGDMVGCHGGAVHKRGEGIADLEQTAVVFHHVAEALDILPVEHVFLTRGGVGVFVAVLAAAEFLAAEEERDALRGHHDRSGELVHEHQILMALAVLAAAVDGIDQLVIQTKVVVAGSIGDALGRHICPAEIRLTEEAGLQIAALAAALHKALVCAGGAALDGVADGVVKRADAVIHLRQILLICHHGAFVRLGGHVPRLAVHEDLFAAAVLIQAVERRANIVHGGDVVQTHQVKAEAVDMVFLRPVGDGIDHVFAEHQMLGGGVVGTARAVGEGAVLVHAVVVVGHRVLEPGVSGIGVVVHHVHDHADAGVVERLDHLLALLDAHRAVIRIGGKGALGHIVVDRVIAPVELLHDVLALVNGAKVIHGHDLHILDAELFEVVHAGGRAALNAVHRGAALGKREELAAVALADAARFGGGKVRHRDLPHTGVGGLVHHDMEVVLPVVGIGLAQIHDHAALAVDAAGACIDVRRALGLLAVRHRVVVVFAGKIAADGRRPNARLFVERHVGGADGLSALCLAAVVVDVHGHGGRLGRPHLEGGGFFGVDSSQIIAAVCRFVQLGGVCLVVRLFFVRRSGGCEGTCSHNDRQYSY